MENITAPANTYRKNKAGEWVVYGPTSSVKAGATVAVTKRDGSINHETIGSLGKPFVVGGHEMVYGYIERTEKPRAHHGGRGDNLGGVCRHCRGVVAHAPHHQAMDGLCGGCAFDEYDM